MQRVLVGRVFLDGKIYSIYYQFKVAQGTPAEILVDSVADLSWVGKIRNWYRKTFKIEGVVYETHDG